VPDTFEIELTTMAHGGAALGRHNGRAIFVPYTLPGERALVRVTQDKTRFAFAEALEIITPSPARVASPCPHFGPGRCGGCHWQHINYASQLEHKRQIVVDQLERIGKFVAPEVLPTHPSPILYGYRSHMTFALAENGLPGLWSDDNSHVVPIDECHILSPALAEIYPKLALFAPDIARIRLQVGSDPADRTVILDVDGDGAPEVEVDLPISVNLITGDNEPVNLIGSPHVTYQILHRVFRVTAGGFFQANLPMTEVLVKEVMSQLGLSGAETVLDLYSGVGMLTAFVAEQCGHVTSVESYPPAVTDAEFNLMDLSNIDIIEGSVEAVLADLDSSYDCAVVDPPHAGLGMETLDHLLRLAPPRIVYVSHDPATLARDAQRLVRGGYRLRSAQPLDMSPQTSHIDVVATLER